VLKNGAYIDFQGGSNINLTAATATQLEYIGGLSSTEASKLAGMLVFEDRQSEGTNKSTINGNSLTVINGKIYLPKSTLTFSGTAKVTTQCLLIAAKNITLEGTTNMTSFCPDDPSTSGYTDTVGGSISSVKLVA
jgi:hypothetical protein